MRVEICGIKTAEDVKAAIDNGADALGFLVGQVHPSSDFILPSTAGRLAASMPPYNTPVLVTHLSDVDEIINVVLKSSISTLQLHGFLEVEQIKELSERLPAGGKICMAAYIAKNQMPDLVEYYPFIDAVMFDAYNPAPGQTGVEYRWNEAAAFIAACPLPVVLTGGLGHDNIAEAIAATHPYAVSANRLLKDAPGGSCCPLRCRAFVSAAKSCHCSPR